MLETAGLARTDGDVFKLVQGVAVALLVALIVAALYFGRDVFVPIALAVLLSFVLAPVVGRLEGWRVPRAAAVIGVAALAFLAIFAAWRGDCRAGGATGGRFAPLRSQHARPRFSRCAAPRRPRARSSARPTFFRTSARN